jgi:hypothetical protein
MQSQPKPPESASAQNWEAYEAILAADSSNPNKPKLPPMADLTIDNLTPNTIVINSQGPDRRLTFVLERLLTHLHDFARETRLSSEEWLAGLNFFGRGREDN